MYVIYTISFIISYTKEENTQLSWKFERTAVTSSFPLGVKTMYRAYASDEVYELIPDPGYSAVGHRAMLTRCKWYPVADASLGIVQDGMHVCRGIPTGPLLPDSFDPEHLGKYDRCVSYLMQDKWYGNRSSQWDESESKTFVMEHWREFGMKYPAGINDVCTYLINHELHIPLHAELFPGIETVQYTTSSIEIERRKAEREEARQKRANAVGNNNNNNVGRRHADDEDDGNDDGGNEGIDTFTTSGSRRAATNTLNVGQQIAAPSVRHTGSAFFPSRLVITSEQRNQLDAGLITMAELQSGYLKLRLSKGEYEEAINLELLERLKARGLPIPNNKKKQNLLDV